MRWIGGLGLPDFIIIGAGKSGTTSLFRYLSAHPGVFACPAKEPRHFAYPEGSEGLREGDPFLAEIVRGRADYETLFDAAPPGSRRGEASVCYLPSPVAAQNIASCLPDVRLVAILRDPSERAWSHHQFFHSAGVEPEADFWKCHALEEQRRRERWFISHAYVDAGFYWRHLSRYLAHFPREQLLVLLAEDLSTRPEETLARVFSHIGVDPHFKPPSATRHNQTRVPRIRWLHRLLNRENPLRSRLRGLLPLALRKGVKSRLNRGNAALYPPMPAETRARLVELYREDILSLQAFLERDLSSWLAR